MCRVGGIHFSGALGNRSRASIAWASSIRKESGTSGSISKAWPRPSCQSSRPGLLGEVLVEELAGGDRVRRLDGVGGGEVVVLAGVDDDAGAGVDLAAEPLVDEGADRVDVAEEDAVHRVVEHHVEPLEPGQRRDLRHAEPGGVVGEPDVAPELATGLVERGAHQAEVLLGGVGAGEALAGRALGHEVEQGLAGRADHRDHVGALAGGVLGLRDVLVDVAGRHDQVDPGLAGGVADLLDHPLALAAPARRSVVRRRRRPCATRPGRGWRRVPRAAGSARTRPRPSGPASRGRRPRRAAGRPRPAARRRARGRCRRGRCRRAG